jgi:hypothetical protein
MPIPVSEYRTIGDQPRYLVQSPQRDLVAIPFGLTMTAGAVTTRAGTPTSVRLEVVGNDLRIFLPFKAISANISALIFTDPAVATVFGRNQSAAVGYVHVTLPASYTGKVEGIITCSNYVGLSQGPVNQEPGANLRNAPVISRSLYPACTVVEDSTVFMLRFRASTGGEINQVGYRGPLYYIAEKVPATTGQYRLTFTFGIPFPANWVFIGTTSLGGSVSVLTVVSPNEVILQTRDSAGAIVDLADDEKVSTIGLGPTTKAGSNRYAGAVTARPVPNSAQVYPLKSLIRGPVMIPFAFNTDVGLIVPSTFEMIPIGCFAVTRVDPGVYFLIHGTVPFKDDKPYSPWQTAIAQAGSNANIDVNYEYATEGHLEIMQETPVPVGADTIRGIALISTDSEW